MKNKVEKLGIRTTKDWCQAIQEVWDELSLADIQSLINKLPELIRKCIAANGETVA